MLGAIIGDIAGSRYERENHKSKDFELFPQDCHFTDDSVMTLAVFDALLENKMAGIDDLSKITIKKLQQYGRKYPNAGYGSMFRQWLKSEDPKPYGSWGNGSAMRISPVIYFAKDKVHLYELVDTITSVTHNHPNGIKGARAIAWAAYLARLGATKEQIRREIESEFYKLDFTIDELRPTYKFDVSCEGSVPQAIVAFLESTSYEDAIRNAISLGGDSDTIAAMAGAIAEQFWGIPEEIANKGQTFLDMDMLLLLHKSI